MIGHACARVGQRDAGSAAAEVAQHDDTVVAAARGRPQTGQRGGRIRHQGRRDAAGASAGLARNALRRAPTTAGSPVRRHGDGDGRAAADRRGPWRRAPRRGRSRRGATNRPTPPAARGRRRARRTRSSTSRGWFGPAYSPTSGARSLNRVSTDRRVTGAGPRRPPPDSWSRPTIRVRRSSTPHPRVESDPVHRIPLNEPTDQKAVPHHSGPTWAASVFPLTTRTP